MPRDTLDISDRLARRREQDARDLALQKRKLGELVLRTGAEKLKIQHLEALLRWGVAQLAANPRAAEDWQRGSGFPSGKPGSQTRERPADPHAGDLLARAAAE